jgi:predicted DNA-binding transcriptional regulator AlpA
VLVKMDEAAAMLSMGRSSFYKHVRRDLKAVYRGEMVLFPVDELKAWAARNAK